MHELTMLFQDRAMTVIFVWHVQATGTLRRSGLSRLASHHHFAPARYTTQVWGLAPAQP